MTKKIILRSCVVTKEKHPKRDLIRIVKNNNQQVLVDLSGKANGRGAYLKKEFAVLEKAKKSKVLEKSLGISIPDCIYEELEEYINNLKT